MVEFSPVAESDLHRVAAFKVRVAVVRSQGMIGYTAIFGAALSGYAGMPIWAAFMSTIALISLSQARYGSLYWRGQELGLTEAAQSTLMQSSLNALMASSAAYCVGLIARLI